MVVLALFDCVCWCVGQVAVDVVFPGVEVEVETEGDDIDEDETEGATASTQGHETAGSPGGMDGEEG